MLTSYLVEHPTCYVVPRLPQVYLACTCIL